MGAGHGHASTHPHPGARHRWRLAVACGLVTSFFLVEVVVGWLSQSLALLSDAGHMAADVVALASALVATRIATRADKTGRRTFGSYRAEVFASALTVLLMLGAAAYVAIEALRRLGDSPAVAAAPMVLVGALGLVVNVIALLLLRGGAAESLNVRGAYLEVVADTVGSIGVIVAGVLVSRTGDGWWDTVVALAIAVFVAVRALMLGREVLVVLGQHAPAGLSPAEIEASLFAVPGVDDVHDLHVWTLTSGMHVATAHLMAAEGRGGEVLETARVVLRDEYGVEHATLQVESPSSACDQTTW
ncbi:cation diffusion facilitator family transporter [Nocardioides sp.]|uniref:cation diffusion facilitator family transporter n=1 Tax=Nocardioides sp. TaxID=35761 RepID=UPI00286E22CB|nr:cation diffusion facilitator family transporter [Nocardioides sp.]